MILNSGVIKVIVEKALKDKKKKSTENKTEVKPKKEKRRPIVPVPILDNNFKRGF